MSLLQRVTQTLPAYFAGAGVLGLTVVILTIVLTRNLEIRVSGLLALSQIIGVWITFILAGELVGERRHIQIGYFAERLPAPYDQWHEAAVLVVNLAACLLFLYSAFWATTAALSATVTGLDVPMAVYFVAPLLGMGFMTAAYLSQLAELFGLSEMREEVASND